MRKFTVSLMNYRCFSGPTPVTWKFEGEALTSYVGPNNGGKSTFLRLFFELRRVFQTMTDISQLANHARRSDIGLGFEGVDDAAEIPSFGSTTPSIIDFATPLDHEAQLCRVRFTSNPETGAWTSRLWAGPNVNEIAVPQPPVAIMLPGTQLALQSDLFAQWMQVLASRVMYVPAYRNLINQGGGTHYDVLVGTEFIKTWDNWKNGASIANRRVVLNVIADIKEIFGFSELAVDATPGKDTLQIIVDGRTERIRELGAGLSQFIMVLGNVAIKRPEMLFIDEPELNLHPALQMRFLAALGKYSKHVVFGTHSMGLARGAERVYSVTKENGSSTIRPLPGTKSYAELLGEMSFSAYQELGIDQLLCVEGITDVRPVQSFLRRLGLDQKVVVIPLGGDQFITADRAHELGELKRITERIFILIDSEKTAGEHPLEAGRQEFVATCEQLGLDVHVTQRRALEHYFTDAAVKAALGPSHRALQPYEDFATYDHAWAKSENWRIAERMTAADLAVTDVGEWLAQLGA